MPSNHFDFEKSLHRRRGEAPYYNLPPTRSLHSCIVAPCLGNPGSAPDLCLKIEI